MVNLAEVSKQSRVINPNLEKGIEAAVQQTFPNILAGTSIEIPKYKPDIPTYGSEIYNIAAGAVDPFLKVAGGLGGSFFDFLGGPISNVLNIFWAIGKPS